MALQAGIVGLPNVGKSTLFNALTSAGAASANFPFCTIEPNTGMVPVPDPRLAQLRSKIESQKILPAMVEMTVSDEDLFQGHPRFGDGGFEFIKITARIGQRRLHGFGAPDQRAILLKRRHRQDRGAHRGRGFVGHAYEMAHLWAVFKRSDIAANAAPALKEHALRRMDLQDH